MITDHQAKILDLATFDCLSNKQIALSLTMTVNGVKCLMYRAYADLGVRSREAALERWEAMHPPAPAPKVEKTAPAVTWKQRKAAILASTNRETHQYTGRPAPVVERAEQLELI